jgi:hypothetical protein
VDCKLNDDDWEELIILRSLLYDFWDVTVRMEGEVARKLRKVMYTTADEETKDMPVFRKTNITLFNQPPKPRGITTSLYVPYNGRWCSLQCFTRI